MTMKGKPRAAEQRLGVYTTLDQVPERYRLDQHASAYAGRDVWAEFITDQRENHGVSEWYCEVARKSGRYWKEHMNTRGRHHALATPKDVERWCEQLLETRKVKTVYSEYWLRLEHFYSWLQFHTEHPHVYHPVRMAAAEYTMTGKLWQHKIDSRRVGDSDE